MTPRGLAHLPDSQGKVAFDVDGGAQSGAFGELVTTWATLGAADRLRLLHLARSLANETGRPCGKRTGTPNEPPLSERRAAL